MLVVEWRPSAQADLLEILEFIAQRNQRAADQLLRSIEHDLEQAAEHPYLYKHSQRLPGLREIVVHPNYVVFYRVTSLCVEVVSVVHARRQYP